MTVSVGSMPAPREVRRFPTTFELRKSASGVPVVVGYAAIFDEPYEVVDWLGSYDERIARTAFDKTLSEADVRYFYNHDGLVFARTKSGTMKLSTDDHGLHYEAELDPRQSQAMDLVYAIERGDVDQSSFSFAPTRQEWDEDYTHRTLNEVKLFDVSSVAFPMNAATSSGLRMEELLQAIRGAGAF